MPSQKKKNDVASMAADLQAKGNILVEMSNYEEATRQFERSLQLVRASSLSQDIENNATLLHHFNLAGIAVAKGDYAAARTTPRNSGKVRRPARTRSN